MNDISGQYFTVYIDTSIVAEVVKRLGCISCSREHKISTSCQDAVKVSVFSVSGAPVVDLV